MGSVLSLWSFRYGGSHTSLKDVRLSFFAMNFLRWRTVAWAEQRIHFLLSPLSLLLLHSRHILTWTDKTFRLNTDNHMGDLVNCIVLETRKTKQIAKTCSLTYFAMFESIQSRLHVLHVRYQAGPDKIFACKNMISGTKPTKLVEWSFNLQASRGSQNLVVALLYLCCAYLHKVCSTLLQRQRLLSLMSLKTLIEHLLSFDRF